MGVDYLCALFSFINNALYIELLRKRNIFRGMGRGGNWCFFWGGGGIWETGLWG